MVDEAPQANGNGTTKVVVRQSVILARLLGGCIAVLALLGIISIFKPPAQWDFVLKVLDFVNALALMITGGLLALMRAGTGNHD